MDYNKLAIEEHEKWGGKFEIISKAPLTSKEDLSVAYTPGVAAPCLEIKNDKSKSYTLTARSNLCLVVTDGSAVLGLGNIGPEAAMPVMEGKCILFKRFGNVDAIPLCINSQDVDEIVNTIYRISPSFGGINLEDISAPRCFEIERRLKELCDIFVFHDDQHGTAVVVLSGLLNALKLTGKKKENIKIVMNGAGAAGTAIAKLLLSYGFNNITMCDLYGVVHKERETGMNPALYELAEMTNPDNITGTLSDAISGADVFIGVSAPDTLTPAMVKTMNDKPIIFACANPNPEIHPQSAIEAGAFVVATGRSDYPNQINNVLAFPGIFRGAFDAKAYDINDKMKIAAAEALAELITESELSADYIIPDPFDGRVPGVVAEAVKKAAIESGVVRG